MLAEQVSLKRDGQVWAFVLTGGPCERMGPSFVGHVDVDVLGLPTGPLGLLGLISQFTQFTLFTSFLFIVLFLFIEFYFFLFLYPSFVFTFP